MYATRIEEYISSSTSHIWAISLISTTLQRRGGLEVPSGFMFPPWCVASKNSHLHQTCRTSQLWCLLIRIGSMNIGGELLEKALWMPSLETFLLIPSSLLFILKHPLMEGNPHPRIISGRESWRGWWLMSWDVVIGMGFLWLIPNHSTS